MELSILKLASPRRRSLHSGLMHSSRFALDNDLISNPASPVAISPSSQRWCSSAHIIPEDDDMCTIFEQHRAAVPFKWEESPGTRRAAETLQPFKGEDISVIPGGMETVNEEELSEQEDMNSEPLSRSSSGLSGNSRTSDKADSNCQFSSGESFTSALSGRSSDPEYEFLSSTVESLSSTDNGEMSSMNAANGQVLQLKPPPRMQPIKQLLTLETDDRCFTFTSLTLQSLISNTSPKSKPRRSFRKDGLKALPFLTSPRKEHNDEYVVNTMLGFEEWPKMPHENGAGRKVSSSSSFGAKCDSMEDDLDSLFNEDFGKKGGLRERRPLSSLSSRNLADGYSFSRPLSSVSSRGLADGYNFRNKLFAPYDSDCDYSDTECNVKNDRFHSSRTILEEEEEKEQQPGQKKNSASGVVVVDNNLEIVKLKRKKHALRRLRRFFKDSLNKSSSVWPAPPTPQNSSVAPAPLPPRKSSVTPAPLPPRKSAASAPLPPRKSSVAPAPLPTRKSSVAPAPPSPPKSSAAPASVAPRKPSAKSPAPLPPAKSSVSPAPATHRKSSASSALQPPRKSSISSAPVKSPVASVPASLVARTQGELKLKRIKQSSKNPLLQMCLSNSFGQALLKNVKQIRSFEFHTPRAVTAK